MSSHLQFSSLQSPSQALRAFFMAFRNRLLSVAFPITLVCSTVLVSSIADAQQNPPIRAGELTKELSLSSSEESEAERKPKRKLSEARLLQLTKVLRDRKAAKKEQLAAIEELQDLGDNGKAAVLTLTKLLNGTPKDLQLGAINALGGVGSGAKAAVPQLITLLKDSNDDDLRAAAATALGRIGESGAGQALGDILSDPTPKVKIAAIEAIGGVKDIPPIAVQELIQALSSPAHAVKIAAINTLRKMQGNAKAAVPALIDGLSNKNMDIRTGSATALGAIGAEARDAIPALSHAMRHPDPSTRVFAANALNKMGSAVSSEMPELRSALSDSEKDVRRGAAMILGGLGADAREALPDLIKLLQDRDKLVRLAATNAVLNIARKVEGKVQSLSVQEIQDVYAALNTTLQDPQSELHANPDNAEAMSSILRSLKNEKNSRPLERVFGWGQSNPALATLLAYVIAMPTLWLAVLLLRPLWLLRVNNALQPYTDFEIPSPLGGSIKVPLRFVLIVGWLHYHPRVLDAWVNRQMDVAREAFAHKSTVSDRKVYIPIPVVMDGNTVPELNSQDLQSTFWDGRQCLLIWGEGGIGKTSLACHLAKWAMADHKAQRLCRHRMLPVLIEQELDFKLPSDKNPLRESIRGQVQAMIDATEPLCDEFLDKLLRQRRILVIVDRLSELSDATRQQIRPGHPDFPANALIVTSRVEESLDEVPKTAIKPLRIEGNRLSSFLEAYLMQRGQRELFTDSEYFDACSQLSKMVGQRHITVLLATLYAEQMIGKKNGMQDESLLPDNIPDLMLSYLNELNRDASAEEPNNLTVHEDAKVVAWECLRQFYHPAPAKREVILRELQLNAFGTLPETSSEDENATKTRLQHLEKRLRIVQAIGPAQDQICFALDPLAECLAALHLVELYGSNQALWDEWLMMADATPGAPESIQGFLLAMRDCCLSRATEIEISDSILEALGQRVGLSAETLRKSQIEQRMKRLAPLLSTGDLETRLSAIRELGELGAAAKGVLPALIREFQDRDWKVRREVARAIALIGPEARSAVPALVERLRDEDRRVSSEAIAALGKLGMASLPALMAALESEQPYIRSSAAWVLGSFSSMARGAVPALTHALKDEDWQVRWVAAYALGCIGPEAKSAIPALIEAFRGEYELVSKEASRTLWRISGEAEAIVAALGDLRRDNDRN